MPGDTDDAASMTPNCWRGPHGDSKRKEKEAPRRQSLGPPAAASSVLQLWACFACAAVSLTSAGKEPRGQGAHV